MNRNTRSVTMLERSTQISSHQSKSSIGNYIAKLKFSENMSQVSKIKGLYWFWTNLRTTVLWLGWTEDPFINFTYKHILKGCSPLLPQWHLHCTSAGPCPLVPPPSWQQCAQHDSHSSIGSASWPVMNHKNILFFSPCLPHLDFW